MLATTWRVRLQERLKMPSRARTARFLAAMMVGSGEPPRLVEDGRYPVIFDALRGASRGGLEGTLCNAATGSSVKGTSAARHYRCSIATESSISREFGPARSCRCTVWCGAGILGAVSRAVKLVCLPSFQKHSCCPKTGRVIRKLGVWMAWEVGENAVGRSVSQFIFNFLVCWFSPRTVRSKLIRADHRRQLPRNGAAHTHTHIHIHVHDEMR